MCSVLCISDEVVFQRKNTKKRLTGWVNTHLLQPLGLTLSHPLVNGKPKRTHYQLRNTLGLSLFDENRKTPSLIKSIVINNSRGDTIKKKYERTGYFVEEKECVCRGVIRYDEKHICGSKKKVDVKPRDPLKVFYNCKRCQVSFGNRKSDYERHLETLKHCQV